MSDIDSDREASERARRALLTRFVSGESPRGEDAPDAGEVHRALREDPSLRELYDVLALADRRWSASGGAGDDRDGGDLSETPRGDFERGFGEESFLCALDGMLADESAEEREAVRSREDGAADEGSGATILPFRIDRRGAGAAFAAVAAAAAVALVWGPSLLEETSEGSAPGADESFRARSARSVDEVASPAYERPRVEVYCVHHEPGGRVRFEGSEGAPMGVVQCPRDAEIKLAYAEVVPELRHAAFFGVDDSGRLLWYGPTPASEAPVRVESRGPKLAPVGESIRLSVNHRVGAVRLYAIFSPEPIGMERLRTIAENRPGVELFGSDAAFELGEVPGVVVTRHFDVVPAEEDER